MMATMKWNSPSLKLKWMQMFFRRLLFYRRKAWNISNVFPALIYIFYFQVIYWHQNSNYIHGHSQTCRFTFTFCMFWYLMSLLNSHFSACVPYLFQQRWLISWLCIVFLLPLCFFFLLISVEGLMLCFRLYFTIKNSILY